jgi:UPF0755 protein
VRKLIAVAIALGIAALAVLYLLWWGGGASKPTTIMVEEGATLGRLCPGLERKHLIPGNCTTYRAIARLLGSHGPIQAGEFEVQAGTGGAALLDLLQHGRPVQRLITVTEGMPAVIVGEKLAANAYLAGPIPAIAEGSLLPDSYGYQRGETRAALVSRMKTAMDKAIAVLWPKRSNDCPVTTPEQAVTLASIVEKETGKPSERPMVAGVYCNRLRIGMKLDADPTIIYPVTKGKPLGRHILPTEIHAKNDYNTYTMAGLPIGPITNPGKASIEAVLHPAATKALYFVADGTGGHVFSETLAQQNANVVKLREIRRQQGQM